MGTKIDIAKRESIRIILTKLEEPHVFPVVIAYSEIVNLAATKNNLIHVTTIGKAADDICATMINEGYSVKRLRRPNACFVVSRNI